jgi:hypothetical protein
VPSSRDIEPSFLPACRQTQADRDGLVNYSIDAHSVLRYRVILLRAGYRTTEIFFVECSGSSCAQRTISIAPKRDRGNTFVVLTMIRIRHPGAFLKTDPGVLRTVAPRTIAAGPTRRRDHLATLGRTPRGPVRPRSHCRRRVKHEFAAANATFVRSSSELYGLPSSGSRSG